MELKLGPTLSALLRQKDLTLKEVGKACGVSVSTLSEWGTGREPKSPIQVAKVAEYLGVTLHYLLFGIEDQQGGIEKILKEQVFSGTYKVTVEKVKLPKD